jgi:radical SAM superfamily enzyme YgiQ (UPF0313 family)
MKILLVSANTEIAPSPVYPVGLDYVAGIASHRHDVKILDLNENQGLEKLRNLIGDFNPDLIGLSLRNIDNQDAFETKSYIDGYKRLMSSIRSMTPAKIVLGGSGFTIFPSELMEKLGADYGIVGDGEQLTLLLDAIETQSDISCIPGVMFKNKPFPGFPDSRDMAFQRHFDVNSPHVRYYLKQGGILNLQTKRGCPFHCIYCTYPHIDGNDLRLIDPDEVARTALMLQNAGARYLFITDSTFNCSIDHSLSVAKAFIKARLSIPWGAFFAPFRPIPDYYKIMVDAGLTHVEFGTESLCDRVLSAYGKPFYADDIFCAHQAASDAGLHIAHYLLFGGPGEDEKTIEETLTMAGILEKTLLILFCGIRIYPHTAIHRIAVREGQITSEQNLLEPVFYRSPALNLDMIENMLRARASECSYWVLGSGNEKTANIVSRLHARGRCGPLWEQLIS